MEAIAEVNQADLVENARMTAQPLLNELDLVFFRTDMRIRTLVAPEPVHCHHPAAAGDKLVQQLDKQPLHVVHAFDLPFPIEIDIADATERLGELGIALDVPRRGSE